MAIRLLTHEGAVEDPVQGSRMKFAPEYADCVAHAAASWGTLELHINIAIWGLADVRPALGACLTAQIYTLQGRLAALLSLLKVRKADQALVDRVNKFSESVRGAQTLRNRIVHDVWLNNLTEPEIMGRLVITAEKKLNFILEDVSLEGLRADLSKIFKSRQEAYDIRVAIEAAIPLLPKIPHGELHPIRWTPPDS